MCDLYLSTLSFFFFFKQKTAYEMRISDWSSDVCSSDLLLDWLRDRCPVRRGLFFTHGDPDSIASLRAAVAQWKQPDAPHMLVPQLDESYSLLQPHPKLLKTAKPAARPTLDRSACTQAVGGPGRHTYYTSLMHQLHTKLIAEIIKRDLRLHLKTKIS